jgi:hypothetical protein
MVMKCFNFRDKTSCSLLKVNRRFGGTFRLYLQGRKISQARSLLLASRCFLAWLILRPWRWSGRFPPKHWLTFHGLHGIITQKIELLNSIIIIYPKGHRFRRNTLTPYSRSKNKPGKKQVARRACFLLISYLDYSSTLKMEAVRSSDTSAEFWWTIMLYIVLL